MRPKLYMRREKDAIDLFAAFMNVNSMMATEQNFSKLRKEVDRAEKRVMKEVRMKRMKGVSIGNHPYFQKRGSFDGEKMVIAERISFNQEGMQYYDQMANFVSSLGFQEKAMAVAARTTNNRGMIKELDYNRPVTHLGVNEVVKGEIEDMEEVVKNREMMAKRSKKKPLNRDRRMKEILKKDAPKRRGEMPPPTKKYKDKTKYDRKQQKNYEGTDLAAELIAVAKELTATEFKTKAELDKYLKDHPNADRSKHTVKETGDKGEKKSLGQKVKEKVKETVKNVGEKVKKTMEKRKIRDEVTTRINKKRHLRTDIGEVSVWPQSVDVHYHDARGNFKKHKVQWEQLEKTPKRVKQVLEDTGVWDMIEDASKKLKKIGSEERLATARELVKVARELLSVRYQGDEELTPMAQKALRKFMKEVKESFVEWIFDYSMDEIGLNWSKVDADIEFDEYDFDFSMKDQKQTGLVPWKFFNKGIKYHFGKEINKLRKLGVMAPKWELFNRAVSRKREPIGVWNIEDKWGSQDFPVRVEVQIHRITQKGIHLTFFYEGAHDGPEYDRWWNDKDQSLRDDAAAARSEARYDNQW